MSEPPNQYKKFANKFKCTKMQVFGGTCLPTAKCAVTKPNCTGCTPCTKPTNNVNALWCECKFAK